jgi:signal peptidase I
MSAFVSTPPPSSGPAAVAPLITDVALPLGQPVRRRIFVPLILVFGLAAALALVSLHDHVVYYRVDSGSMAPTLPIGTRVAVEPGAAVQVGEIIAFHAPAGAVPDTPICAAPGQGAGFSQPCGLATPGSSKVTFIKRVVAGPGQLVSIRAGHAIVDGVVSDEPFAAVCDAGSDCDFPTAVRVPRGQYYVLGDNRGTSDDSRFWGPVPAGSVIGVVVNCHPLQTDCQPRR